jgi:CubicO group peptidase (beta-lactamase class C family)
MTGRSGRTVHDVALGLSAILRRAQAKQRAPSVSAAVFRGGEPLWAEAVGLADVAAGREATPETRYPIASITKSFVAVAIMQLRDAGSLALDDPVQRHLPEAPARPTIATLLSHASGIQREVPGSGWDTLEFPSPEEIFGSLGDVELVLESGEWHYSNLGYVLLGEVVARVARMPIERYVDERILGPLGLEQTTWGPSEPAAQGYLTHPYAESVLDEPTQTSRPGFAAAGGLWSTTGDLARFGGFLYEPDPQVLAPETLGEMRRLRVLADPQRWTRGWGLGLILNRIGERVFVGHEGGAMGAVSTLMVEQESGVGAVVLANTTAGFDPISAAAELAGAVLDAEEEVESWRPAEPAPADLAGVLGRWWSEGYEFVFSWRDGRLEARGASAPEWRRPAVFERVEGDRFRTVSGRERGEWLEIVRDGDGTPTKLYWATYACTRDPRPFGAP